MYVIRVLCLPLGGLKACSSIYPLCWLMLLSATRTVIFGRCAVQVCGACICSHNLCVRVTLYALIDRSYAAMIVSWVFIFGGMAVLMLALCLTVE